MMKRTAHNRSGFSLLELLLSLGIFVSVMMGIMALTQTYAEREVARSANRYMETLMAAVQQMLKNPTNFNALYEAAAAAGGGYQLIADEADSPDNIMNDFNVTSVATGTVRIQGSTMLNANFKQDMPLRSQVRILLRVADAPPPDETDVRAMDVMLVTTTPRPYSIVQKAAAEGGYSGGYIRGYTGKAAAVAESAFGSWRVTPSSRLNTTNWYTGDLLATLNVKTQGAYLVHYAYTNLADVTSDYLYRTPDPSPNKRLNTMYGPINMGGNDIIGADDVNIGDNGLGQAFALNDPDGADECEGGVLCVEGTTIVKGSASVAGTMTVTGTAQIAESANFNNMRVENGLAPDRTSTNRQDFGAQGLFVVDGNEVSGFGNTDAINVTNTARFEDGVTANAGALGAITATSLTMPQGGTLQANALTNARRLSATTVRANSLNTRGPLKAETVIGGNVTSTSVNRVGVIDILDMDSLQQGTGTSAATRRIMDIPRLNAAKLSVTSFGACGDCPQ